MKLKIPFLLMLLAVAGLFSGCSEPLTPTPVTYSQLLTGTDKKAWRLTTIQVVDEGQASQTINIQSLYDPCIADDQYVFYANEEKRFEATEGATKCSAQDPDVFLTDSWALINAKATLEFVLPLLTDQKLPFTIKNLTDKVMTLEFYFQDIDASYRFTFNAVTTR
ncbi:hypothetical protein [Nibrella saemangeumensis]